MSERKQPAGNSVASTARGRRRWPWILGAALGLILLVLLVAPVIAAPIVQDMLIDAVHEHVDARASLEDLSIGLGGHVRATGFRLAGPDGELVVAVDTVDVQADVFGALAGRYAVEITVDGLAVHARQDQQGEWNLASIVRGEDSSEPTRSERESSTTGKAAASEVPELKLSLRVRDGVLSVHTPAGLTELRDLTVSLDVADLSAPAPFHVSGRVVGPTGPGGELRLDGTVTLAHAGRLDPAGIEVQVDYMLRDLLLPALLPAVAALISLDEVAGVIEGTGQWSWRAPLELRGNSSLRLRDLRLAGPAVGPQPIVLPVASLTAEAQLDADGTGVQTLTLEAGELLTLHYEGSTQQVGDDQHVKGTLQVDGRLAGLMVALRDRLGIKPTVLLDGGLEIRADIDARWGADGLGAAALAATASLTGLSARSADGTPLDLGELTGVSFELLADADLAAGTARLQRLQFDAGPVTAGAQALISGLSFGSDAAGFAGMVVQDSSFSLDADLDRLQQILGPLFETRVPQLGGRALVRSSMRSVDGAVLAESTLTLVGLVLRGSPDGPAGDLGPLDLELEQKVSLDLSPGGRTELERFTLRSPVLTVDASGTFTDLADAERIAGTLEQRIELKPGPMLELLNGWFGPTFLALFGGLDAGGQPVLVQSTLRVQGPRVQLAGRMTIPELLVRTGGVLDPDAAGVKIVGLDADFTLDPGSATDPMILHIESRFAGPEMLTLTDGTRLSGAPLSGVLDLRLTDDALVATGRLAAERVLVELPPESPDGTTRALVQRDVEIELDLSNSFVPGAELLTIRALRYSSQTARASVEGRLEQLSVPAQTVADLRFSVQGEVARLLADAGALLPMEGTEARGELSLDGTLTGTAGVLSLAIDGRVDDLWIEITPPATGVAGTEAGQPIVVSDPRVELQLQADVLTGPLDVTLTRGRLDSSFLSGEMTGEARNLRAWLESGPDNPAGAIPVRLDVDMNYDATQLGALLAAWLPGRFTGSGRYPLRLTVAGDLASAEGLGVLVANGQVSLAPFQLPGVLAAGDLGLQLSGGLARLVGELTLNEGRATLDAALDLRPEDQSPRSTVTFTLDGLQATEEMGPLLASLHPLFASDDGLDVGSISGAVNAQFELSWDGVLPLEAASLASLPLEHLSGRGRVEFPGVTISGSQLLGQMLGKLGAGEQETVSIAPMSFELSDGRLAYAEPWPWMVSSTLTNFTGSVGLDGSLALDWNVPITEHLMEKHKFLRKLAGQTISIPIEGSISNPKLRWSKAFDDLAEKALRAEVKDRLKDKLGGKLGGVLDGVLGGSDAGSGTGLDADELLAKADELWAQGKRTEARPLYKELKERHKLTLVYVLNKDRIKKRAKDP